VINLFNVTGVTAPDCVVGP